MLSVIATLIVATSGLIQTRLTNANRQEKALRANYAAQAGLQMALEQLTLDPDWEPLVPWTQALDPHLSFAVSVVNNRSGSGPVTSPDGSAVLAGSVWLKAVGIINGETFYGGFGEATQLVTQPEVVLNQALAFRTSPTTLDSPSGILDTYSSNHELSILTIPPPGERKHESRLLHRLSSTAYGLMVTSS